MKKEQAIKLFEQQQVRTHWDEDQEKWYFSVQDVVQILSESKDVKQYIKKCDLEIVSCKTTGVQFVPYFQC
ncbi:MAG: hypothetical protein ACPGTO_04480 [Polaribacter sp.]